MRTVQKNVFLILNSLPVSFVTNPELIRPSISIKTHSLDQKVMAKKAKARKRTAESVGNFEHEAAVNQISDISLPPATDPFYDLFWLNVPNKNDSHAEATSFD